MYPFERFTERAKKTLTLAQEEAQRSHHSYIGTEHLLLGLLRQTEGEAYEVLSELRIDIDTVRQTIATVLGRNERIIIQQIIPTSRVKMVIEIAFEEARRLGHESVDTGHLLMALAIEGEGIAAHVLEDLGASAEKVIAALERKWDVEPSGRGKRPQPKLRIPGMARSRLGQMRTIAGMRQSLPPSSDAETLQKLLGTPAMEALLRSRGLDVDALAKQLAKPPEAVTKLRAELSGTRSELANAVAESAYERAALLQKTVTGLETKLKAAEYAWLKLLGR
jgi:ATP-dependent Clp protease ATP-binding subunit ClpA